MSKGKHLKKFQHELNTVKYNERIKDGEKL